MSRKFYRVTCRERRRSLEAVKLSGRIMLDDKGRVYVANSHRLHDLSADFEQLAGEEARVVIAHDVEVPMTAIPRKRGRPLGSKPKRKED